MLKGRRCRTADSTIFADAVATQDTVTQLIAAIRRAARQVPRAAAVIAAGCGGFDYSQGRRPVIDWSDPQAAAELVSALVNDADTIVTALRDAELDEQAASALALLRLVAGQDVEPAEGSDGTDGRWRIADKTAQGRMVSQVDPESRHARKNRHALIDGGYRAHLSAEPSTGLITDEELTMASGEDNSDAAAAARFVAASMPAASRAARQPAAGAAAGCPATGMTGSYLVRRLGLRHRGAACGDRQAGDEAVIKPSRSSGPSRAGSPSMTSPSITRPVPRPARPGPPGASPPPRR